MMKFLSALLLAAAVVPAADAGPFRRHAVATCSQGSCAAPSAPAAALGYAAPAAETPTAATPVTTGNALDQVNAQRAARGLRPFLHDPLLTAAAEACATHRAGRLLFGHTESDFRFLPPGADARAAGCAAYPASYGFMACCTYENYTFAGAASVVGRDGKMYHHIFVR